jgi:hypothetical protein
MCISPMGLVQYVLRFRRLVSELFGIGQLDIEFE